MNPDTNKCVIVLKCITIFVCLFISTNSFAQLTGIKTIGGSSPDYSNFSDAVTALNAVGVGVGGVTFLIRDLNETLGSMQTISAIGTETNQIVFKSENEDADLVVIKRAGTPITLTCKYVTFQHITIQNTSASGSALILGTNADNNTIDNCFLIGCTSSGTTFANATIYSSQTTNGNGVDNFTLKNSILTNGNHGIYMTMNSTERPGGLIIENNVFENFKNGRGIYLLQFTAPIINGNTVRTNGTGTSIYGISIEGCQGKTKITNNYIYTTESGYLRSGIALSSNNAGSSGNNALMANNSIQVINGSSAAYAIEIAFTGNNYWDIYNNTIYISGGTSASNRVFSQGTTGSIDMNIINNIFVNASTSSSSYSVYFANNPGFNNYDNNVYWWTEGANFSRSYVKGGNRTTFADHIAQSGETNSYNIDPEMQFVDGVGWKATAIELIGRGQYFASVPNDIDEVERLDPTTIGAHELATGLADDAGILSIDEPDKPFPPGENDIYVTLRNYGTDNLTSVTIEWEVNEATQTNFDWTGNLATEETESVNIGSFNFSSGIVYEIKVRTVSPNSHEDVNTDNDEAIKSDLMPGLAGTYTIGSTGNFISFNDATDAMANYGLSGAVIFDVQSDTYSEQVSIPVIPGNSSDNTITFKSESGDRQDVLISHPSSTGIADNYTLQINGVNYLTIQDMSIERTGTSNYAVVIDITGDSKNIIIDNNIIIGRAGGSGSDQAAIFSGSSFTGEENITVSNNHILNGYNGIYFEGKSNSFKKNIKIEDNILENYRYGIYLQYIENADLYRNKIINATTYNGPATTGIYLFGVNEILLIRKNEIIKTGATNNYGIELLACVTEYSGPNDPGEISNNMITVGGTGTSTGIYTNATKNKNFYYNSILTTGTNSTSSKAMYVNGPYSADPANNANFVFINNILMADYGIPMYNSVGGIISCNNNNYFSVNNATIAHWDAAGDVETIAELQAANSDDTNSISDDPLFVSDTDPFDLHITESSPCIDNAITIDGITDDIDDDLRNPDIGADEYDGTTPVGLLKFNGNFNKPDLVMLHWTTASETNNDYFTIERSYESPTDINNINWNTVVTVKGAGTSNHQISYSYTDNPILNNSDATIYYRLKQTDFDGTFKYCSVIAVQIIHNDENNSINVYPNPFDGKYLNIYSDLKLENPEIEIYNLDGKKIYNSSLQNPDEIENIYFNKELNPGLYILKIYSNNIIVKEIKVIIK
ncbi:MAG TPA: T9SS type A sorting domain-containing protein [Bacteroidales bacterium]|nr:T9SS type A sorting domain-containing protein [Bacteroidales bacterium]